MDDRELFDRLHGSLRRFYRLLGDEAGPNELVELHSVTACIARRAPERSVCNGVVYDGHEQLAAVIDQLAESYAKAGVRAWTVWTPEDDGPTADLLASRGHALDAKPAAMALELDAFEDESPRPGDFRVEPGADPALVGRLNDDAYGYRDFEQVLDGLLPEVGHWYVADLDGEPCASTMAFDSEGDCGIFFVATLPEARGRGIAGALMSRALRDAKNRGCTTSSLQATRMGEPIYERLGYRTLCRLHMWEQRQRPAGQDQR